MPTELAAHAVHEGGMKVTATCGKESLIMDYAVNDAPIWTRRSIGWLIGITLAAAGLAAAVTLLNLAGRAVMELGGFVASGGPYEIAHPAPGWILLVPASILLGFACGGLSVLLSVRTGGFSLLPLVWSALFVSLGVQFAIMGFNPPQTDGWAWGWIVCAVVFIPMGLMPLPALLRRRPLFLSMLGSPYDRTPRPYQYPSYKLAYRACVTAGIAGGVAVAFALFGVVAG